jgi:signal transduction histidine kinase
MECRKRMQVTAQLQPVDLGATERVMLYRIAQEALTNVTRHSAASAVSITLEQRKAHDGPAAGIVMLRVADNGRGFDADGVAPGHLGLSIMRERAEAIAADLALRTAPGHGTELIVSLTT